MHVQGIAGERPGAHVPPYLGEERVPGARELLRTLCSARRAWARAGRGAHEGGVRQATQVSRLGLHRGFLGIKR